MPTNLPEGPVVQTTVATWGVGDLSADDVARAMLPTYVRGDRLILRFLLAHFVVGLGLASFYDTWSAALVIGGSAVAMFAVSVTLTPTSRLTRFVAGIALQTFVALHIYQMHGLAEQHFWFFTAFTVMIVYQDWVSMWPGALLIIGQHILFAILHNSGVQLYFFQDAYIGATKLFFHFGIALVQVAICGYWAHLLRLRTLEDAVRQREVEHHRRLAEAATEAKSQFLANMSHEIRTPMNGVVGMTRVLLDTSLTHAQRQYAETVSRSADALLTVINDILDFSKIEAGKLEVEHVRMDIAQCVEDATELVALRADEKNLEFILQVAAGTPRWVSGDPGRLRQVLLNLLTNAVKFTERGHVTLSMRPDAASTDAATGGLLLAVSDTGIGIPEERLPLLFGEFMQADASTTRRFGGTGLGLAISKRLVELMGGTIAVDSEEGRGTTFRVWLPLEAAERPDALPSAGIASVLVVRQHALSRDALVDLFSAVAPQVSGVSTVDDAIAYVSGADLSPLLVCIDQEIADTSRLSHVLAAQARSPRLVLLCPAGQHLDRAQARALGFDAAVTAPVGPARLAELMAALSAQVDGDSGASARRSERVADVGGLAVLGGAGVAGWAPRRLLLAEDNAVNRLVAVTMLRRLGYEVDVAEDGQAALDLLDQGHVYDAVLLDCHMPVLDGYQTARAIRLRTDASRTLPIIAVTASALAEDRARCLEAGMDDVVAKPIQVELLATALRRWCETARGDVA